MELRRLGQQRGPLTERRRDLFRAGVWKRLTSGEGVTALEPCLAAGRVSRLTGRY